MIKDYEISVPVLLDIDFEHVLDTLEEEIGDNLLDSTAIDMTDYQDIFDKLIITVAKDFCSWALNEYNKMGLT